MFNWGHDFIVPNFVSSIQLNLFVSGARISARHGHSPSRSVLVRPELKGAVNAEWLRDYYEEWSPPPAESARGGHTLAALPS